MMPGLEDRASRYAPSVCVTVPRVRAPGFDAERACASKCARPISASVISARRAEAEILFARKVRGQKAVLRFVNRRRNNSEILPEHAAEGRRTRKAPRKRDVRDGFSGLGFQLLAAVLQSCVPDIVADGGTPVAEQHVQVALGAAPGRRDLVDGKIRVAP